MWRYVRAEHIADQYDEFFAENRLFHFDAQVVARHFTRPGVVADLGCGTGRIVIELARRGFEGLAVDLSPSMLRIVAEKARRQRLPVRCLRANLVELDCIASESVDYAVCLFSTLGMIHGRAHRRQFLEHARRILKPGGLLAVHVHNVWFNLFDAAGRRWLLRHLAQWLRHRGVEFGDKVFDYRGISKMYLHTFTQTQLLRSLREAQFEVVELIRLNAARQRPLRRPWLLGRFRANGWIAVCRKGVADEGSAAEE